MKIVGGLILFGTLAGGAYFLYPQAEVETQVAAVSAVVEEPDTSTAPIELEERTVPLPDGTEAVFRMPKEFEIAVAAEDLGKARFMAESPDGRIFVPDLVDYKLSHQGKVYIVEDFDPETKTFGETHTYLTNLRGPNSLAFYTDEDGKHWLYIALTAHLVRYPYEFGDTKPSGEPEIVAEFPNSQSPGEVSVVWHITRTIFFHEDRVYVSVGSGCNSCEQLSGDMRAMIYSMKPDGSDKTVHGDGLRNTVGIHMAEGQLYATANGVDHLGEDRPDEVMYKIVDGTNYGWPFCYALGGKHVPDTSQTWDEPVECDTVPAPLASFEPRSAPLGLRYFGQDSHPILRNSFLVALHGSFEPEMGAGYQIVRVRPDGTQDIFMDGFLKDGVQLSRPVDFFPYDANSFFFTDDHTGRIYYVYAR